MAIRLAFNATPLLAPLTGIGNYIVQLGRALGASGDFDFHSFYGLRWQSEWPTVPASTPSASSIPHRWRSRVLRRVPFARDVRRLQQQVAFRRGLHDRRVELYHEPNYVPLAFDVPFVVTVHDLSWIRYPETHPVDRVRWLEQRMPRALERAGAIVVDSDFVRNEVLSTFAVPAHRVQTAHLGVAPCFRPMTSGETRHVLAPLDLVHGSYVLSVGTLEPRKNVGHVIDAHAMLPSEIRARFPLVVAGAAGWRAAELEQRLARLAAGGAVRFLGRADDDALPALYAGAAAFVFPSRYEGFGLPPLEAMACGVPVLVADRASLPEVVGNAGLLLDPDRPEATAALLRQLLEDDHYRAERARACLVRARAFTWESCAESTRQAYVAALGRSGRTEAPDRDGRAG